jgi:hypothetical protein
MLARADAGQVFVPQPPVPSPNPWHLTPALPPPTTYDLPPTVLSIFFAFCAHLPQPQGCFGTPCKWCRGASGISQPQ